MKKIYTLLFLLLSHFSFSQNLVPNPSFETYDTCPSALGQIERAIGWSEYRGTPDYYNSCAPYIAFPQACVSVPLNSYGNQDARTGNAYAGFEAFNYMTGHGSREYLGIQLIQPLTKGQEYFASFYISRAANTEARDNIATNKLGMKLSTVKYSLSNPAPIDNNAYLYTDSIVTDTLNWTEIKGTFTADSEYQYLYIGNFFNDSATSFIAFDSLSDFAYYYIDDVYLSEDSANGIAPLHKDEYVNIFPNPARDWIVVEGRGIFKITVYDLLGKCCFYPNVLYSSLLNRIDVSSLSKGIYFLSIETTKENVIQKLIIE